MTTIDNQLRDKKHLILATLLLIGTNMDSNGLTTGGLVTFWFHSGPLQNDKMQQWALTCVSWSNAGCVK